MHSEHILQ